MRISDWSSDVCSSDLDPDDRARVAGRGGGEAGLDHIDLQRGEGPCHAQLGVLAHREAGRLLAVAQAGVEDANLFHHAALAIRTGKRATARMPTRRRICRSSTSSSRPAPRAAISSSIEAVSPPSCPVTPKNRKT